MYSAAWAPQFLSLKMPKMLKINAFSTEYVENVLHY